MSDPISRRGFVGAMAGCSLLAILPACSSLPAFTLEEAIRRLLERSSRNAFATLLQPGGFYDNEVARIDLPPQMGGSGAASVVAAILASATVRRQLVRIANTAAEEGAERAAPLVADAIRMLEPEDAAALIRGGPTAATDYLRGTMGASLVEAMVPEIGQILRLAENDVVTRTLAQLTDFDLPRFTRDIGKRADDSIWNAIASEERRIRADPQATDDPVLIAILSGAAR